MKNRRIAPVCSLLLAGFLLAACAGQQEPAQRNIEAAEASIAAMREDATKYVPDELKELEDSLAGMKANYQKGDYSAVLTAGRVLNTHIKSVGESIASHKEEMMAVNEQLTEQWNTLSAEVPEMVESVTARVESLTKSGKLPKDVDTTTFERVKTDAATMAQRWQQALGAFSNGNMQEAVDMAVVAKEKAESIMLTLAMS